MAEERVLISIKDIFSTQINDDNSTKISMSGLLEMPLNKAIEAVDYLWKYHHVTISDITPEIRDIMDLAIRFKPKEHKKSRTYGPCQNYKCEFYRGINNPDPENNCSFIYLQENCIDYKE